MTLEESYEIYNNYYQNIYGMYDDNWIDYDLDVAFTKLAAGKNTFKKDIRLDHQEKNDSAVAAGRRHGTKGM